jgi:LAO/AO transport system kinase
LGKAIVEEDLSTIAQGVLKHNHRSIARAISIVENGSDEAQQLVQLLFKHSGRSHLIGITGSPGVGKSTLVDALISQMTKEGLKVGVLAIDPTSPFTGGAILGDRIRMQDHTLNKNVFIRSMANRGYKGGIALSTYDAVRVLEASGCQIVIIETVGVGQSELAIAKTADTTVLVLMPGTGDDVQAIKSGIMEIGDVFVVNKGDLPGANRTYTDVMASLELNSYQSSWRPPVVITCAENNEGIENLWQDIKKHKDYLDNSGELLKRRKEKIQTELTELVADMARDNLTHSLQHSQFTQDLLDKLVRQEVDPHSAAQLVVENIFNK